MNKLLRKAYAIGLAVLLMLSLLAPVAAAAEPELAILFPSEQESVIAPGRDFYIIGTASAAQLSQPGLTVQLFRAGEQQPLRSLTWQDSYSAAFEQAVPLLDNCFNNDIPAAILGMPDLVYDTKREGSGQDGQVKIAVTEHNFCALILGGLNDDGLSSQGEMLTAGDYHIVVTLASGESVSRAITLADTADKVICRYSPSAHYAAVSAYAAEQGWRMYIDPFPGYWSPGDWQPRGALYEDGQPLEGAFMESFPRWRFADALEYEAGRVHLFIYNISATCASQNVELAAVQRSGRVDSDLLCYYYDLGEPLFYGGGQTLRGELRQLEAGDKLQFCRAHIDDEAAEDNSFLVYQPCLDELDRDFSDGLCARQGQTVSLFGLTAPLQNSEQQLSHDGKNAYSANHCVSSIRYTIYQGTEQVWQSERPVGLQRQYTEGRQALSVYEFRHNIDLSELRPGQYRIQAQALDEQGAAVAGGGESFDLTVLPSPLQRAALILWLLRQFNAAAAV